MRHVEAVWTRILGVLLILLGLTLWISPRVPYTRRERIANTPYRVKREKAVLIPAPVALGIAAAGVLALYLARSSREAP